MKIADTTPTRYAIALMRSYAADLADVVELSTKATIGQRKIACQWNMSFTANHTHREREKMKMTMTMGVYDFRNAFLNSSERKDQFSYQALTALFEYLEELEIGSSEDIEFDMVAICCEYCEYDTALEAAQVYDFNAEGEDLDPVEDEDELEEAAMDFLNGYTTPIVFDGGVIIQNW